MTNPPTTTDRLMSICIIYMLMATVLSTIGIVGLIFVPVYRSTLALTVLCVTLSGCGAGLVWAFTGLYQGLEDELSAIPKFFRKHWKIMTWREEEVIEE